jgi:hypothetical protein
MRDNIEGARLRRTVQEDAETNLMQVQATTTAFTLSVNSPPVISIDPGVSAVNITMYAPVPPNLSPQYLIINRAAATGTLVIKQTDGSTTAATIAVGKMGIVAWDGTAWRASSLP